MLVRCITVLWMACLLYRCNAASCSGQTNVPHQEILIGDNFTFICQRGISDNTPLVFKSSHNEPLKQFTHQINDTTVQLVIPRFGVKYKGVYVCKLGDKICHKITLIVLNPSFPPSPKVCYKTTMLHSSVVVTWTKPLDSTIDFQHVKLYYKIHEIHDNYTRLNTNCHYYTSVPCDPILPYPCKCPNWTIDGNDLTCTFESRKCLSLHKPYTFEMVGRVGTHRDSTQIFTNTYDAEFGPQNYCLEIAVELEDITASTALIKVITESSAKRELVFYITSVHATHSKVLTSVQYIDGSLRITDLNPYTQYSFIIKARHSLSSHWSKTVSLDVTTNQNAPSVSPHMISSTFTKYLSSLHATIYWQPIPVEQQNGPIIDYNISVYKSSKSQCMGYQHFTYTHINDIITTSVSVSFVVDVDSTYRIENVARNMAGYSSTASLYLRAKDCYSSGPGNVTAEEQDNSTVIVRAFIDNNITRLIHYCIPDEDSTTFICKRDYHTRETSENSITLHLAKPRDYMFGISTYDSSVTWTNCLYQVNAVPRAPTIHRPKSQNDHLLVEWQPLTCDQSRGILQGFYISVITKDVDFSQDNATFYCNQGTSQFVNASTYNLQLSDLTESVPYVLCVRGVTRAGPGEWGHVVSIYSPSPYINSETGDGDQAGLIAGITVGVILFVVLVSLAAWWCCKLKKKLSSDIRAQLPPTPDIPPYNQFTTYESDEKYDSLPKRKSWSKSSNDSGKSTLHDDNGTSSCHSSRHKSGTNSEFSDAEPYTTNNGIVDSLMLNKFMENVEENPLSEKLQNIHNYEHIPLSENLQNIHNDEHIPLSENVQKYTHDVAVKFASESNLSHRRNTPNLTCHNSLSETHLSSYKQSKLSNKHANDQNSTANCPNDDLTREVNETNGNISSNRSSPTENDELCEKTATESDSDMEDGNSINYIQFKLVDSVATNDHKDHDYGKFAEHDDVSYL